MIRVTFKCGHPGVQLEASVDKAPVCPVCGDRQIANTHAPAPKFKGVGSGPVMVKG